MDMLRFSEYGIELVGPPGQDLAARLDDGMVPAAYRSPHFAIQQFEAALNEYNTIYQRLPSWARLCWTLPYPPGPPSTGI